MTANIKDCACCGAMVSATVYKEFLCHNLGANTSLDPNVPVVGLNGAYVQWGKRGPNTTGDSRVDWQTAANDGSNGFAAAPNAGNSNSAAITGWSSTAAADFSWRTAAGVKTANDPCPSGYRVPTITEWLGVQANNTLSATGTSNVSATNYGVAIHYGPNASNKLLTLPLAGFIEPPTTLNSRGGSGFYASSTEAVSSQTSGFYINVSGAQSLDRARTYGYSVRCIAQ